MRTQRLLLKIYRVWPSRLEHCVLKVYVLPNFYAS